MPKEGVFCRVVRGGRVRTGDPVTLTRRTLRVRVLTLSDRASRGEYPDRSGPRIREMLDEFAASTRWRTDVDGVLIPDEPDHLVNLSPPSLGRELFYSPGEQVAQVLAAVVGQRAVENRLEEFQVRQAAVISASDKGGQALQGRFDQVLTL